MFFTHTHMFVPLAEDPETLWCTCGKSKDIHRHQWKYGADVIDGGNTDFSRKIGESRECIKCGFKAFFPTTY